MPDTSIRGFHCEVSVSDVERLGNARFRVETGGRSAVAYAAVRAAETWVFLDGQLFVITDRKAAGTTPVDAHRDLSAPMPATVIAINVSEGQQVKSGEALLLLEAMKMELPIVAPHDGVIGAIRCTVGELVQPGVPLVDLS